MNTSQTKLRHLLPVLLLGLASCEGGTTFTNTIDNQTAETLTVKLFTTYGVRDPVTVPAGESTEIFWDDQVGFFVDDSHTCTEFIDSVQVTVTNGRTLAKDLLDSDQWEKSTRSGRNSRVDCTFVLTEADLE